MKILIIYNPVSGKSTNREQRLGKVLMELGQSENEISVYQMKAKGDGTRFLLTKKPDDYELIVTCGGDGTLHEIVDASIKLGFKGDIGYIPAGSTNDYASNLGIRPSNAIKNIIDHNTQRLDLGVFNGECFNYVAAFGIFTDVTYSTPQPLKNSLGYLAYLMEGAKEITDIKPIHIHCETDSAIIDDDVLVGIITNTLSVGGVKLHGNDAQLDDGMMEYIFIRYPRNPIEFQNTLFFLVNQKFDQKYFYYGQSTTFKIQSDPMEWTLDGEGSGEPTGDVLIETLPAALSIIVGD